MHRVCTLIILPDREYVAVGRQGHYRASKGLAQQIFYVVQTDQGQQTLTPEEFADRYDWKNDPEKARLILE